MKRIHKKGTKQYRPYLGKPYESALLRIAKELNKTSLHEFDDLAANRHAVYELWMRVFPSVAFPADADILRTPYHRDPATKDTVQSV